MTPFHLKSCVWEITLACCFSCQYCGSGGGIARPNELSTQECIQVAHQLGALGCRRVSLIGGEVFMRRDWAEIVHALTAQGIRVSIITNGFLFTPALLRALAHCGVESVAVSIDGPERIHDKYRQPGSYHRAVKAIGALHAAGIPVSIISTLNTETAGLLEEFYSTVSSWPIAAWQLQACSPMGNAAAAGIDYAFDPAPVMQFVMRHQASAPFLFVLADNIGYFSEDEGYLRGDCSGMTPFPGCAAGLSSIGIDSIGNVRGCESMYDDRFIEGNLRERTLADIWNDPAAFSYNRRFTPDQLTGHCSGCAYGAYCAGGCRSYNYFVHGKLYESPMCHAPSPNSIRKAPR